MGMTELIYLVIKNIASSKMWLFLVLVILAEP